MEEKRIFWADNDTQNAIELYSSDLELAAIALGVPIDQVNSCERSEISAYRVSLKNDPFLSL